MEDTALGATEGVCFWCLGLSPVPWGFSEECGRVPARLGLLLSFLPAGGTAVVTTVPALFSAFGYQQLRKSKQMWKLNPEVTSPESSVPKQASNVKRQFSFK